MKAAQLFLDAIKLSATNPIAAADLVDQLIDQLQLWTIHLRSADAWKSREGFGDQVRIQVVGPDGVVKEEANINRHPEEPS